MSVKLWIGIDPGQSGGLAFIPDSGSPWAMKMPETTKDLVDVIKGLEGYECFAVLEAVHAMPKQGVTSSFTFGRGYGHLEMVLTALDISFERATPQKWQKAMGCMTKGDKNVSKRKAQELFPSIKVTHALADALLIAEFNRRTKSS